MAEIAIPAVALGAMYILSNRNEDYNNPQESFTNRSAPESRRLKMEILVKMMYPLHHV